MGIEQIAMNDEEFNGRLICLNALYGSHFEGARVENGKRIPSVKIRIFNKSTRDPTPP